MNRPLSCLAVVTLVVVSVGAQAPATPPQLQFLDKAELAPWRWGNVDLNSVAMDGDVVVIGMPTWDNTGIANGGVIVLEKPAAGWTTVNEVAILTAAAESSGAFFGSSVAIEGDTIVVGARVADASGVTNAGAVYVFEKPAGGWTDMTETAKLFANVPTGGVEFGASVSIEGDLIAVGCTSFHGSTLATGAVFLFERLPGASWTTAQQAARLEASDGDLWDQLGVEVVLNDQTVFAATPWANVGGNINQGAVYVFEPPTLGWSNMTENMKFTSPEAEAFDYFGHIGVDGGTLVVGAPGANNDYGTAYVYQRPSGSSWTTASEIARLTRLVESAGDNFGTAVDIDGSTIVVGAPDVITGAFSSGAVYTYERPAGGWVDTTEFGSFEKPSPGGAHGFGSGVDLQGPTYVATGRLGASGVGFVYQRAPISFGTGCGLAAHGAAGSTRIGQSLQLDATSCSAGTLPFFLLGTPLATPFALPPATSCGGTAPCLLACNPIVTVPGPQLSLTWPNDPTLVGASLCTQSVCLDSAQPCLEISDLVSVTVSQ